MAAAHDLAFATSPAAKMPGAEAWSFSSTTIPLPIAVALERLDPIAEQERDAVLDVHVPVEGPDLAAEDPLVR
jgi:hypothetical protein